MAFQPRGSHSAFEPKSSSAADPISLNSLGEQVAEAVPERLIQQGVPLSSGGAGAPASQPTGSHWQQLLHEGADRLGHAAGDSPFQPHLLQGNDSLAAKIDHTLLKPDATREE